MTELPDRAPAASAANAAAEAAPTAVPPWTTAALLTRRFLDRPGPEVAPDLLGCVLEHETADGLVAVVLTEVEAYNGEADPASHAYRGRTPRNAVMFGPSGHAYVYFTYGMHFCVNVVCMPPTTPSAVLLRAGRVIAGEDLARRRRSPREPKGRPAVVSEERSSEAREPFPRVEGAHRGRSPREPKGRPAVVSEERSSEAREPFPRVEGRAGAWTEEGTSEARERRGKAPGEKRPETSGANRDLARGPARLCQALGIDRKLDGADLCAADSPLRLRAGLGGPLAGEGGGGGVAPLSSGQKALIRTGPRVGVREGADVPWRFWLDGEPTVSAYRPYARRRR